MYSRVNLSSGRAGSYFTRDYITQSTGHWFGKGAERLGLFGIIKKDQWDNNINGRDPEGRQIIQNGHGSKGNQDRRSGMDNCFSAPKDVSVLASKDHDVVLSHDNAVKTVLSNMEEKYSYARKTVNGITRPEQTGNLVFGVFRHFCSRYPYDPQLHSHSFESNMTQREDGEWRAVHNDVLFKKGVKHHIGLMYRSELASNLRELGYEIESDSRGFFRVLGMPKEITDHFSRRKAQVEEKYQELRMIYPHANEQRLKEMAALGSREPKKEMTLQDLRESWDKQITELGFSWEKIREDMRHEADIVRAARNKNAQFTAHDYVRTAAERLSEQESVFDRMKLLDTAAILAMGHERMAALDKAITDLETNGYLKVLDREKGRLTTAGMLITEQHIEAMVKDGRCKIQSMFSPDVVETLVREKHPGMTEGQMKACGHVLSSTDRIIAIQGDAGTGKTSMLSALRQELVERGITLRGFAYTGKAAMEMESVGIESRTLHSFLRAQDNRFGIREGRELWIIDEASMVGSRQMESILQTADRYDARVVFIGDSKQLQAIDAGSMFTKLQEKEIISTVCMSDIVRQQETGYRAIVREISSGNIDGAFEKLSSQGKIIVDEVASLKSAIIDHYVSRDDVLVITTRNASRKALNDGIREKLIEKGQLEGQEYSFTVRDSKSLNGIAQHFTESYQENDIITVNRSGTGIKVGQEGRVVAIDHENHLIHVELSRGSRKGEIREVDLRKHGNRITAFTEHEIVLTRGEKVLFTRNSDRIGVRNGHTGFIEDIDRDGGITVSLGNRTISFNLKDDYNYITYGYAVTDFKSQGMTSKEAVVYAPVSREEGKGFSDYNFNSFYVAASRGKHDLRIYTNDMHELREQVKTVHIKTSTLDYMPSRSSDQTGSTGHEVNLRELFTNAALDRSDDGPDMGMDFSM